MNFEYKDLIAIILCILLWYSLHRFVANGYMKRFGPRTTSDKRKILLAIANGKKLRHPSWSPGEYIYFDGKVMRDDEHKFFDSISDCIDWMFTIESGWEIL